jgi:dTDP-4-dehydrorhamnose reductase
MHGVWHWTESGADTWYGFAQAIGEEAHRMGLLPRRPEVTPISTSEYPTRARRPAYSLLDSSRTIEALGMIATPWRENMVTTLKVIATHAGAA